ncbi:TM2 domain-containing protein [uncultured Microscilla sp.]|uniref:TM2 domain-containing protein n=1 Tax=uncultured Microscilla sp. TaxID=432653 RepID=UPI002613DA6A|nr:TM2 domain-containing protein [uncultured Microscilla sp.]
MIGQKKQKIIAVGLALTLGTLGIHRFYLGQKSMGVSYLLASCTIIGLPIVLSIAVVDCIGLIVLPHREFERRYNPQLMVGKA